LLILYHALNSTNMKIELYEYGHSNSKVSWDKLLRGYFFQSTSIANYFKCLNQEQLLLVFLLLKCSLLMIFRQLKKVPCSYYAQCIQFADLTNMSYLKQLILSLVEPSWFSFISSEGSILKNSNIFAELALMKFHENSFLLSL